MVNVVQPPRQRQKSAAQSSASPPASPRPDSKSPHRTSLTSRKVKEPTKAKSIKPTEVRKLRKSTRLSRQTSSVPHLRPATPNSDHDESSDAAAVEESQSEHETPVKSHESSKNKTHKGIGTTTRKAGKSVAESGSESERELGELDDGEVHDISELSATLQATVREIETYASSTSTNWKNAKSSYNLAQEAFQSESSQCNLEKFLSHEARKFIKKYAWKWRETYTKQLTVSSWRCGEEEVAAHFGDIALTSKRTLQLLVQLSAMISLEEASVAIQAESAARVARELDAKDAKGKPKPVEEGVRPRDVQAVINNQGSVDEIAVNVSGKHEALRSQDQVPGKSPLTPSKRRHSGMAQDVDSLSTNKCNTKRPRHNVKKKTSQNSSAVDLSLVEPVEEPEVESARHQSVEPEDRSEVFSTAYGLCDVLKPSAIRPSDATNLELSTIMEVDVDATPVPMSGVDDSLHVDLFCAPLSPKCQQSIARDIDLVGSPVLASESCKPCGEVEEIIEHPVSLRDEKSMNNTPPSILDSTTKSLVCLPQLNETRAFRRGTDKVPARPLPSTDIKGAVSSLQPGQYVSCSAIDEVLRQINDTSSGYRVFAADLVNTETPHTVILKDWALRMHGQKKFLVPLHFGDDDDAHWTLGVINFEDKLYSHYNSIRKLNYSIEVHAALQAVTMSLLNTKVDDEIRDWLFQDIVCPQQENSTDCGICCIIFAVHVLFDRPLPPCLDEAYCTMWRSIACAVISEEVQNPVSLHMLTSDLNLVAKQNGEKAVMMLEGLKEKISTVDMLVKATVDIFDTLVNRSSAHLQNLRTSLEELLENSRSANLSFGCNTSCSKLNDQASKTLESFRAWKAILLEEIARTEKQVHKANLQEPFRKAAFARAQAYAAVLQKTRDEAGEAYKKICREAKEKAQAEREQHQKQINDNKAKRAELLKQITDLDNENEMTSGKVESQRLWEQTLEEKLSKT